MAKTWVMQPDQPICEPDLHDYVLRKLNEAKGTWPTVAEGSGVPYDTITKIAQRQIGDPKVSKLQRLANYFKALEAAA